MRSARGQCREPGGLAATAVAAGVAANRFGRRRILMWYFVLTAAADLAVFLVPDRPSSTSLGLTVLPGVGFGAMITGSYAYVKAVAPGRSLGPRGWACSGMFTDHRHAPSRASGGGPLAVVDWRWAFLIVPGMCLGEPGPPRLAFCRTMPARSARARSTSRASRS